MPKKTLLLPERLKDKRIFYQDSTSTPDLYHLTGVERLEIHMYYKARVKKMEREQKTSVLESVILDTIEYEKTKYGRNFNLKNYIKYIAEKCNFPGDKLYSGIQKRRAQRRWAKEDFLKYRSKSSN